MAPSVASGFSRTMTSVAPDSSLELSKPAWSG